MAWSSVLARGGGGSTSRKVQVSGYSYLSEVRTYIGAKR